jgi:hypothetical protein
MIDSQPHCCPTLQFGYNSLITAYSLKLYNNTKRQEKETDEFMRIEPVGGGGGCQYSSTMLQQLACWRLAVDWLLCLPTGGSFGAAPLTVGGSVWAGPYQGPQVNAMACHAGCRSVQWENSHKPLPLRDRERECAHARACLRACVRLRVCVCDLFIDSGCSSRLYSAE